MFARAAIIGRVTRERAEARRNFLATKEVLKKQTPIAPLRRRCSIPFMKKPCLVLLIAVILILGGAVMCNYAFHAETLSSQTYPVNNTVTEVVTDQSLNKILKSFTYIGPALMGFGVFIIIIACVILLDRRDKVLKDYINSMVLTQQGISMELSYRATTPSEPLKPLVTKNQYSPANGGTKRNDDEEEEESVIASLLTSDQNKLDDIDSSNTNNTSASEYETLSVDSKLNFHVVEEGR